MRLFDRHMIDTPAHGNERLHLRGVVGVLLAGAFHPAMRSLRTIDDLSLSPAVQRLSGVQRVARSTLCDALAKFDPDQLRPLIHAIAAQLPQLQRLDPETARLTRRIIAADGSWFNLAGEVACAIACRRGNAGKQSRVRLNLQLDIDAFIPTDFDVSGAGDGSEADAFIRRLQGDCIYIVDRNFVHFGFINAVLNAGSNLVLRMKKNVGFTTTGQDRPLSDQDKNHNVLRDQTGFLSGPGSAGNTDARSCTARPPTRTLRLVTVWDEKNQCRLTLLTDLLDVPAYVIGVLYRLRWQIELFLRWLKVLACFDHLISQSARGMTTQFYVAVMMTLLIHLQTGLRVSKYALLLTGSVATGQLSPEKLAEAMARHERERQLERIRRAKKSTR